MQPLRSYSVGGQRSSWAANRQARRRLARLQGSLVRACEKEIAVVCKNSSEEHLQPFKEKMETFVQTARQEHSVEEDHLKTALRSFEDTVRYFGVKPKSGDKEVTPNVVFMLWFEFCNDFKNIWKRESKNISKERLKEAQLSVQKMTAEKKVETKRISPNSLNKKEGLQSDLGVSHSQITRLYSRFTSLDKGENGTLCREDFQRIPELAINPLGDRIINAFFPEGEDQVNFRGFMRTLAHFRPIDDHEKNKDPNVSEPLNSRNNKLLFAFRLYDLDKDDKISRDELLQVLRMMVGVNISDDQLGSIADRTIQEADQDGDSFISFTEFIKVNFYTSP
ncbi:CHP1 protein, partial [Polyodon spathula]|nr:CHP1 protein [Polyodon spathula]